MLREALRTELGDRFVLVSVRVDPDAIGCVIVTPRSAAEGVQAVLGRERVRPLPLPSRYENLSFRGAVTAMESRLREIPAELDRAQVELQALLAPRTAAWRAARQRLLGDIEQLEAVAQAGATEPRVRHRRLDTARACARAAPRARTGRRRRARARRALDAARGRAAGVDAEPNARPAVRVPRALSRSAARRNARPDRPDGALPAGDGRRDGGRRRLRHAAARHRALRRGGASPAIRRRFAI